jgi:hypothetical protein
MALFLLDSDRSFLKVAPRRPSNQTASTFIILSAIVASGAAASSSMTGKLESGKELIAKNGGQDCETLRLARSRRVCRASHCHNKGQALQLTYGLDFLSIQAYRLWMERPSREKGEFFFWERTGVMPQSTRGMGLSAALPLLRTREPRFPHSIYSMLRHANRNAMHDQQDQCASNHP